MKFNYLSLAARNAFIYFALFIAGLGVSGYILFHYSSEEILELTEDGLEHSSDMISLKFETYLENLETDLNQLANSPLLDRFLKDNRTENLDLLTKEYLAFLGSKKIYFQLRLLSIDSGKELIRVERNHQIVRATSPSELQNKSGSDYYNELIKLPNDSTYFSKIDLNKEFGKISEPITPTLRIAKKLPGNIDGGVIVIINVDLNKLFDDLKNALPDAYDLRVANQDGHYLIHPDKDKTFTFEYNKKEAYSSEFELSLEEITEKNAPVFSTEMAVHKFIHLPYQRYDYKLYSVVSANKETVFGSFYSWQKKVLIIVVCIALVFLLLAFGYMRTQVNELKKITRQLTLFSQNPTPHKLTINRRDEIGELAKGFEQMSIQISESHALIDNARKEAERAFEEKNEFLENMSHEIRNPLQSIIGNIKILEQNQKNEQQIPFINSLKFSAEQLKSLVTDVLDYAKIKKHQVQLEPEWTNLAPFSEELVKGLNYLANSSGIQLTYHAPPDFSEYTYLVDRTRLYQIINNLLTNALKFSKEKGAVNFVISYQNESKEKIRFQIEDDGKGIEKENLKRILERNYATNYTTGVGLGLTIVQELLKLHKSELKVDSEIGQGSRFYFDLDLPNQISQTNQKDFQTDQNDQLSRFKIVVFEDDLELQNWYRYVLKDFDLQVFSTREEAVGIKEVMLVICDLQLNHEIIDLQASLASIRQICSHNGEILVVSGTSIAPNPPHFDALTKPVSKDDLLQHIHEIMHKVEFGFPDFTSIQHDYDYQDQLVKNAIKILASEWKKETVKLTEAIENKDKLRFDAVTHKIITSVKRLKLVQFEEHLNTLNTGFEDMSPENCHQASAKIKQMLQYYTDAMLKFIAK
jgi:signal transduction histidine kinase